MFVNPKIYHIIHIDRLDSILNDRFLFSDKIITKRQNPSLTVIGMEHIKKRRLNELKLHSHPELFVGDCVPFYFCPRSVMLYVIHKAQSSDLKYKGGQSSILHLVGNFEKVTAWAEANKLRWAFTSSNAGSLYFDDYSKAEDLSLLRWESIHSNFWAGEHKEYKSAEFLLEQQLALELIEEIGVYSESQKEQVESLLQSFNSNIKVTVQRSWYY